MNNKFDSLACEPLSQNDLTDTKGGFILFLAALSAVEILLVGTAIYGAYQMGYDKACGCND